MLCQLDSRGTTCGAAEHCGVLVRRTHFNSRVFHCWPHIRTCIHDSRKREGVALNICHLQTIYLSAVGFLYKHIYIYRVHNKYTFVFLCTRTLNISTAVTGRHVDFTCIPRFFCAPSALNPPPPLPPLGLFNIFPGQTRRSSTEDATGVFHRPTTAVNRTAFIRVIFIEQIYGVGGIVD